MRTNFGYEFSWSTSKIRTSFKPYLVPIITALLECKHSGSEKQLRYFSFVEIKESDTKPCLQQGKIFCLMGISSFKLKYSLT